MKTIKVIKTGATAVETRKQLRSGTNKVEIESRPNVGPELVALLKEYKRVTHLKGPWMGDITDKQMAKKLGIFEGQVRMIKKLIRHDEENKEKEESLERRTELQNVR